MDVETIISFIQNHMLETGLILIIVFALRNWELIIISVLAVICLSYFGVINTENIRELITTQIDNLKNIIQ